MVLPIPPPQVDDAAIAAKTSPKTPDSLQPTLAVPTLGEPSSATAVEPHRDTIPESDENLVMDLDTHTTKVSADFAQEQAEIAAQLEAEENLVDSQIATCKSELANGGGAQGNAHDESQIRKGNGTWNRKHDDNIPAQAGADNHDDDDDDDARSVTSQLSEDDGRDLRIDICAELDGLRRLTPLHPAAKTSTDSTVPTLASDGLLATEFPRTETRKLRHVLRKWTTTKTASSRRSLYYRLDKRYVEATFPAQSSLVQRDLAIVNTLAQFACKDEIPLEILLATLEREETIDGQIQKSYLARRLMDVEGRVLVEGVPVDEKEWAQTSMPGLGARHPFCEVVS